MSRLTDKARAITLPNAKDKPASEQSLPKSAPGQLMAFRNQQADMESEIRDLKTRLDSNQAQELAIADLVVRDGRKRYLTHQERMELEANLKANGQIEPIIVLKITDGPEAGKFEVISGHNRIELLEKIGNTHVFAWIEKGLDAGKAEERAFYANLLHPSLPDFEKYRGFKACHEATGKSYTVLADEAGFSVQQVSLLMSFDRLPKNVKSILAQRPTILGASAASALAGFTDAGRGPQVEDAVKKLASEEITQAAAIKLAGTDPAPAKATYSPEKIKAGRSPYAEFVSKDKTLRITLQTTEQREELESEIRALLEKHAAKYKK